MNNKELAGLFSKTAEAVAAVVKPMSSLEQAMAYAVDLAGVLLGSTAEKVHRHSPCTMVSVRGPEHCRLP